MSDSLEPTQPKKAPSKGAQAALFAALARAQQMALALNKEHTNSDEGYTFVSTEQIVELAKTCLPPNGLALVPTGSRLVLGRPNESGVLEKVFSLVHDGGGREEIVAQWPIEKRSDRPYERAYASAQTSLLGYLLRDLLQIPRIEHGEDLNSAAGQASTSAERSSRRAAAKTAPPGKEKPAKTPAQTAADALIAAISAEYDRQQVPAAEREARSLLLLGHRPQTLDDLRKLLASLRAQSDQEPGGPLGPSVEKLERIERAWEALGITDDHDRRTLMDEILGPGQTPSTSARASILASELDRLARARASEVEAAHG